MIDTPGVVVIITTIIAVNRERRHVTNTNMRIDTIDRIKTNLGWSCSMSLIAILYPLLKIIDIVGIIIPVFSGP